MGKITQINVEIDIICENMCEEGSETNFGSEEGLNIFLTLWGSVVMWLLYPGRTIRKLLECRQYK